MRIGIVGGGAAGMFCALKIKERLPHADVIIIEQNDKLGKKVSATGNGKCNIANSCRQDDTYDSTHANKLLDEYNLHKLERAMLDLGLPLKHIDNLVYPYNESAKETVDLLTKALYNSGVVVFLNTKIIDYHYDDKITVIAENTTLRFDRLVFTTGGKSAANLGSDGSLYEILRRHDYHITSLRSGLCPIKTMEKTKMISGQRIKAMVTLMDKEKIQAKEKGEVLFKDDGLSGIVIFNMASRIARLKLDECALVLDCFYDQTIEHVITFFANLNEKRNGFCFLKGLFNRSVYQMFLQRLKLEEKTQYSQDEIVKLAQLCKNLVFHYKGLYPFEHSQVTIGGLSFDDLNDNLSSISEKYVYFAGEILDVDGLCGGFNLMWAFTSAWKVADNI